MTIEEIKNKVRIDSLIKTRYGWKYVCYIHEDGVRATDSKEDMIPFPTKYKWEEILDVRN